MAAQNNQLSKNNNYTIRIATTEDNPAMSEFIKKFFFTAEPLNEAVNRALNHKFIDIPKPYIPKGLTLMAVASSGEIIGVAEVKAAEVFEIRANSSTGTSLNTIHKLLDHVENKITEFSKQATNIKEIAVKVITVHEKWRNKGIGTTLLKYSKNIAQEKGFKQIRSICTSAYTIKMFLRCGFECVYTLEYKDCKEKGIIDFLPQEPHTHVKGMVLTF